MSAFLSGTFDLVTLDHRMPGMHGMELHKALSQEFGAGKKTSESALRKLPPILIVTGYADDAEVAMRQAWGESIVGVIKKPLRMEKLEGILKNLFGDSFSSSTDGA
jgi:CheY-like chemotaxis protein